ncbi:ABC transporter [Colletotrichum salicis]|uniref:ABC transporter n=1 Tax=Colletotrichum salicis TaxID=1209931 RepID=A0A135U937_9PEZI|nr:ABC transporter [Colletotrichum salicis]
MASLTFTPSAANMELGHSHQVIAKDAFACSDDSPWSSVLCYQGYGLSPLLEEVIFSIVPCSIALVSGLHRRHQLQARAVVSHGHIRPVANLVSHIILSFLLLLIAPTSIAIVPVAVVLTSGIVRYAGQQSDAWMGQGSGLLTLKQACSDRSELHRKSLAPSALLQLFLLITIFLDAARVRTAWHLSPQNNERYIALLLTVQVILKVLLLAAESVSKPVILAIPARRVSREETSGIFGKSFATWVNPLLRLGWKKNLLAEDLDPLDEALDGEAVFERLSSAWKNVDQDKNHALVIAVLKAFRAELLFIHIPRIGMVAFGLSQPLLVQTTIEYIQIHNDKPITYGQTLVATFAITYLGLAISTRWSGQLTHRLITRIRGALIAIIYQNMLTLRAETGNSQAAVALMSTEVERITVAALWCVAVVPNLIQLGSAMWIMSEQLGAVSVAPIIIALLSVSAGIRTGQLIPPRQRRWMQAIQKRVGITTEIIGSVKGVKMSGLTSTVQDQVQGLRDFELDESKKFRRVQILNVLIGQFPSIMTPSITFAAFGIISKLSGGQPLNVVQAFTSLSLLGILINPVSELVMIPNNLGAAIGCLDRIQEYLIKEKREDYRLVKSKTSPDPAVQGSNGIHEPPQSDSQPRPLIKVLDGSFGWHKDQAILKSLDLEIHPGSLTILVGTVGSGKSTLLKSLVGETYRISGSVEYTSSTDVAYCDQDPWILNQSIKENIIGGVATQDTSDFYDKVIQACQLEKDLNLLPQGDESIVGSSGSALSGGQKHRIALARAVYSGKQIIIMDDNLKGLDSKTASKCFHALFGTDGLLRGKERAVIFATHNGGDGTISETGLYEDLCKTGGYVSTLKVTQKNDHQDDDTAEVEETQKSADKKDKAATIQKPDDSAKAKTRGAANTSSLLYYIKSMGITPFGLFVAMVIFQTICRIMQRLWVKFWVAANENGGQENLEMWEGVYILWGVLTELALAVECYYFLVVIVPHSAKGLHFSVLKASLSAPLSFFVKTDTGIIINRFSQDMNLVDLPLPLAFMLTFDNLTLAISDITLTTLATPTLSLSIPFLILLLYLLQRIYLQTSRQIRLLDLETKSPLFSHFIASATGLVTIRALGPSWISRVQAQNLQRLDLSQRAFYAMGSLQKWLLLVLNLVVAALAVLLVASAVMLRDRVDAGLLGVALVSVMMFGQLLTQLLNYWAQLETSLGAVARIREFEAETPSEGKANGEDSAAKGKWPSKGRIDIRNVSAAYDDHQVLGNVNLSIQPGEKIAICGRTGSGKSTLLALLLRLHEPAAGVIEVDGVDIRSVPVTRLRESLVALPQDPLFLPGTVRRNLDPFESCKGDADIWDALEKTGLKALFEDKGGLEADLNTEWLSAGQKQLFCMARAILRDSHVLLLDEATSSLDQATEQVVQDLIGSEFQGWTIIVIAHRLRATVDFDKVVTLQDGKVVEFDSPKKLLEDGGIFAAMWKLQEG